MTKSEMRFLRREIINIALQHVEFVKGSIHDTIAWVRGYELGKYSQELKVYA